MLDLSESDPNIDPESSRGREMGLEMLIVRGRPDLAFSKATDFERVTTFRDSGSGKFCKNLLYVATGLKLGDCAEAEYSETLATDDADSSFLEPPTLVSTGVKLCCELCCEIGDWHWDPTIRTTTALLASITSGWASSNVPTVETVDSLGFAGSPNEDGVRLPRPWYSWPGTMRLSCCISSRGVSAICSGSSATEISSVDSCSAVKSVSDSGGDMGIAGLGFIPSCVG